MAWTGRDVGMDDFEGIDTVVLQNELAYNDVLPVQWRPLSQAPDRFELGKLDEANLVLLQACVAVEEQPLRDKHEELTPLAAELARLDFKLNVVLRLFRTLVATVPGSEPVPVQFNARGASWQERGAPPAIGSHGVLQIRLRGSLPQSLDLYAQITENAGGGMSASFVELAPAIGELLQQLCFVKHRQRIAGARRKRNK